jgi:PAS domain-containing protein
MTISVRCTPASRGAVLRDEVSVSCVRTFTDQTAVDGIITIDAGGIIESFNPAAERLFWIYRRRSDWAQRQDAHALTLPGEATATWAVSPDGRAENRGLGVKSAPGVRDGTTFPMALAVTRCHLDGRRLCSRASS